MDLLSLAPTMLVPFIGVGLVVVYLVWSYRRRADVQQNTADYRVGAIAQKLGLRVERGDPNLNLYETGRGGFENQHFDVLLRGARNGVPLELVYFREITTEQGILSTTMNRSWEARITARTRAAFGHLEVTLRQPEQWNRVRPYFQQSMPALRTGNARTDSVLQVRGDNPEIAPALGAVLEPLTSLNYVHVIAAPGEVSFLMSHSGAGRGNELLGVAYALGEVTTISDVLTSIVLTAEG